MAKFDNIIKYLGKEDSFSPDEIIKGIESEGGQANVDDLSSLPSQNMENVEKLLKDSTVDAGGAAGPGESAAAKAPVEEIDVDLLHEIENLDTAPPKIEDLEKPFESAENEFLAGPSETPSEPPEPAGLGEAPSLMEPQFMEMPSLEENAEEPSPETRAEPGAEPELPEMPAMPGSAEGPKEEFEFPGFNTPPSGGEGEAAPETPMPEFELPGKKRPPRSRKTPLPKHRYLIFSFHPKKLHRERPKCPNFRCRRKMRLPRRRYRIFNYPLKKLRRKRLKCPNFRCRRKMRPRNRRLLRQGLNWAATMPSR